MEHTAQYRRAMSVAALGHPADRKRTAKLTLAALGVVFGDIGTSPLYTVKECFSDFTGLKPVPEDVLGILSLITWALIIVVTLKYVLVVMRADNRGEGGVLALMALSPLQAVDFAARHGFVAFVALGAVTLAVTGTEALYADMGHFGARPIRFAWLVVVLPALLANYYGQGALLLADPTAFQNPFFRLAPSWMLYPLIALATAAAVIASQATISGAFSMAQQAALLGLSPPVE